MSTTSQDRPGGVNRMASAAMYREKLRKAREAYAVGVMGRPTDMQARTLQEAAEGVLRYSDVARAIAAAEEALRRLADDGRLDTERHFFTGAI